jgi:MFS superfamily sulfate permease-like transporter
MLAAGSMSASAVKEGAGARSQVTNLVTWAVTIVTLLFLTPLFATLPEAVLAALIIHAVWHIIGSRKLHRLRREAPVEFWFGVLAFAGVIFIDVLEGMIIGLLASLVFVIYKTSRPHVASLGRIPGEPGGYSDLGRHPENTPVPGVVILRLDAPLYYANALTSRDRMKALIAERQPPPRAVIFYCAAQDRIDLTSIEMVRGLVRELRATGIDVYAAEVHQPVLDYAAKLGLFGLDGAGSDERVRIFPSLESAVRYAEGGADILKPDFDPANAR